MKARSSEGARPSFSSSPAWSKHRRQSPLPTCNVLRQCGHSSGWCEASESVRPKKSIWAKLNQGKEETLPPAHVDQVPLGRSSAVRTRSQIWDRTLPVSKHFYGNWWAKSQKNLRKRKKISLLRGCFGYDSVSLDVGYYSLSMSRRLTLFVLAIGQLLIPCAAHLKF